MKTEMPRQQNPVPAEWVRTELVHHRLHGNPDYIPARKEDPSAPYGYFQERRIIGSGMENIIGGVYLGAAAREAIVVDDRPMYSEGNDILRGFYEQEFLPNLNFRAAHSGYLPKQVALASLFEIVSKKLEYNDKATELLVSRLSQGEADKKIHLSSFLLSGIGVCRHQALLVGYLIEKLKNHPDLSTRLLGSFSIERNAIAFSNEHAPGAHVWVRYTTSNSEPWIIDVAQKKIGRLQELMRQRNLWEYARPEERIAFERLHSH